MDSEPSTHPMKKWWLTYSRGISFPERGLRIQTGARQCLGLYFLYLGSRRELGSAWDYIFSIQDLGGSQQCLELYFLHLGSRRELGSAWDYIFSIQDLDGSQVVLGLEVSALIKLQSALIHLIRSGEGQSHLIVYYPFGHIFV